MEAKIITVNNQDYKCQGFDGYNGHYYVTVYNDTTGEYLGQMEDCYISQETEKIRARLIDFLKYNV